MNESEFRSQDTRGVKTYDEKLAEVLAVAKAPGNAHSNHYLRGMANGLILAHAIREDVEPDYIKPDVVSEFNYAAEAEKTCSILFRPEQVDATSFIAMLDSFVILSERFNLAKKLFFRGKTPADLGLEMPRFSESLGARLDGATTDEINIIHGVVGVITEAGEMAEQLVAFLRGGTAFDPVHMLEETGDVEWYQHRILRGINATSDVRDRANIDKLHGRHGDAFNVFRDAHRDLAAERVKLETAAAPLFEAAGGHGDEDTQTVEPVSVPAPSLYGDCQGDNPANPPEPGLLWVDGCWRRERTPEGDVEGMHC